MRSAGNWSASRPGFAWASRRSRESRVAVSTPLSGEIEDATARGAGEHPVVPSEFRVGLRRERHAAPLARAIHDGNHGDVSISDQAGIEFEEFCVQTAGLAFLRGLEIGQLLLDRGEPGLLVLPLFLADRLLRPEDSFSFRQPASAVRLPCSICSRISVSSL